MKLLTPFKYVFYKLRHVFMFTWIVCTLPTVVRSGIFSPPFVLRKKYGGGTVILGRRYYDYLLFYENFIKSVYTDFPAGSGTLDPKTIIDLGGHKGFFSLAMAHKFPAAEIYTVEPNPDNFRDLVTNTKACPRIHPIHAAVWNEKTQVSLYCDSTHSGAHSLVRIPRKRESALVRVDTITPAELPKADFIKCDVEGTEHYIDLDAPRIAMEVHQSKELGMASIAKKYEAKGYAVTVRGLFFYAVKSEQTV